MIASSTSTTPQLATQTLQNSLIADAQATERAQVATTIIPQAAIEEFALRFNAAVIEMLAAQGNAIASPLSKRLRAYGSATVPPVGTMCRFA